MSSQRPILSICLPTYNRAHLLDGAIRAILPELESAGGEAELIVSDNASTDGTPETVRLHLGAPHLRYNRNGTNWGAVQNIMLLVGTLARGEFAWVLGDDDLVVQGAVRRILDVIRTNPQLDYVFVNHTYKQLKERLGLTPGFTSRVFPDLGPPLCSIRENRMLTRWEDIIQFSEVAALHTSIVCHVAKVSLWRAKRIHAPADGMFATFDATFPHLSILAPLLIGKPVYYFGEPQVILFVGAQEWLEGQWGRLLFTHVLTFSDLLEEHGVSKEIVFRYRDVVFQRGHEAFHKLLRGGQSSWWKARLVMTLFARYYRHAALRQMVRNEIGLLRARILQPARLIAGRVKRALLARS